MREFWIKIDCGLPEELKEQIIKGTSDFCTAYVVEAADEALARSLGAKTLVSPKNGDIILFESPRKASNAKMNKKGASKRKYVREKMKGKLRSWLRLE